MAQEARQVPSIDINLFITVSGPPGCGATTLCDRLSEAMGCPYVSGGEVFREVSEAGRYESYYEIDIEDREFYDLHLNTARWNKEGIFEVVRAAIEEYDPEDDEGAFRTAPPEI